MKTTFKPVLFVLLMCGVFGADEYIVKAVREGDSVTLNPDLTQIQGFIVMQWQFKYQPIAYTDGRKPTYREAEIFRDRLELNQTGSLTITNMKTKHSGLYHLQIDLNSDLLNVYFTVTVYESPLVIDAVKGEMKFESVKEGYPVTLQTDVTQLYGDELIVWRCGDEGRLIAKSDMEAKSSPLYDDGRFRGRLELDQTGSLTITNTRTTDSGFYTVKISSKKQTSHKRFTVTVSEPDLSSGAVAGIVIAVLAAVVAAVAAVVVIYHRRKISELQKQTYSLQLTLDLNTVNKCLRLSENNRVISGTYTDQQYPDHPDRFDKLPQVLCEESVCGRCYWEIVWSGEDVNVIVSYKSISRKGRGKECGLGANDQSWCLICTPYVYKFWHNDKRINLSVKPISRRIGVFVDHRAGTLSFYRVSHTMTLIHKVHTKFTQPVYPGFGFRLGFLGSIQVSPIA